MRALASVLASVAACVTSGCLAEYRREFDCSAPIDVGSLTLVGDEAGAKMRTFCDDEGPGKRLEVLTVTETTLEHLDLRCLCGATGSVSIVNNPSLVDLSGLANLSVIGGGLIIEGNASLVSVRGISLDATVGATEHGDSVSIVANPVLEDLEGLPRGNAILTGGIAIINNAALRSLSGLPPALTAVRELRVLGSPGLRSLAGLPQGLRHIAGSLTISANAGLRDLSGLPSALERVEGRVLVSANDNLVSLAGFPANLTAIGGELDIGSNMRLADLSGLPDALFVAGMLDIRGNHLLRDLSGLPADLRLGRDEWTGDSLRLRGNEGLVSLTGLPAGLTEITGDVVVEGNTSLVDLAGFLDHVDMIGGSLSVIDNDGLGDLSGLPEGLALGVDAFGMSLVIAGNDALVSLSGFPADWEELPGGLGIAENRGLEDLTGLGALRRVAGDLLLGRKDVSGLGAPCDWELNPGGNSGMERLSGLSTLEEVGGTLAVECNPVLSSFDTFTALRAVGGDLWLAHNPLLADVTGLGGALGSLTSIGGSYVVLCSPLLDIGAVESVLDNVEGVVATGFDLACE